MNSPDIWIIVKISDLQGEFYKLLAGFDDTWKLSSNIQKIVDDAETWKIFTESGNCYSCCKHIDEHEKYIAILYTSLIQRNYREFSVTQVEIEDCQRLYTNM